MTRRGLPIDRVTAAVYRCSTGEPEADGTLTWDATTMVTAQVGAGPHTGLGWTYSTGAAAAIISDHLAPAITGHTLFDIPGCWAAMHRTVRNLGSRGLVMQALSAVDIALWDLKARCLDITLPGLLGRARDTVPVYGSGGFTTLTADQLAAQVDRWRTAGCRAMKIKIGQDWGGDVPRDLDRIHQLRELAGPGVELMVDANGGYTPGQAVRVGRTLDELGVVWFEEPVSSDHLAQLARIRAAVRCDVAAGEYIADIFQTATLAPVVDCLQLDVTRCGGYTGFLRCAAVAQAAGVPLSAHCAPALTAPVAAAVPGLRHVEWFIDHVRLEDQLLDGAPPVRGGALVLDDTRPGHGMTLRDTAQQYLRPPTAQPSTRHQAPGARSA